MQRIISDSPFSHGENRKQKITQESTQTIAHHHTLYMEGVMWS